MSAKILEGKFFAQQLKDDAGRRAAALQEKYGRAPGLAVIRVGNDPASEVYVRNKDKACAALGIYSEVIALPEETSKDELIARIDALNADEKIDGILVQLPLPAQIAQFEAEILNRIDPSKDVDGFHPVNVGKMVTGEPALLPCTPAGCIRMRRGHRPQQYRGQAHVPSADGEKRDCNRVPFPHREFGGNHPSGRYSGRGHWQAQFCEKRYGKNRCNRH